MLAPAAAQGLSAAALEPFDGAEREGALGAAIASRRVHHLRDLPSDTRFTFKTLAGTAVPRELLTVPLLARERVAAVLVLGSLRPFAPAALALLEHAQAEMSIGLANLLSTEQTARLAAQLTDQNAELQAQAGELRTQSLELERQNLELEVQASRITEANRLKTEFLSNMSHELRTPLNSVLALSRVLQLQAQARLTGEEVGYLEIIERNGKHLLELINVLLDLAKIESGRVEVACEPVSLPERIAAVAETVTPLCREKGLRWEAEVEPGLPLLRSDPRRVHQILQNLIGNAVKFTPRGSVTVRARRNGGEVEVAVIDTGIGIPAHALGTIFEEFRQVDGSTSRAYEGTGLGLAIAAKSARLLGGRISVESTVGAGSTFVCTLPLGDGGGATALPAPPASAASAAPTSGARILVVEDSEPAVVQIRQALEPAGYRVEVARSGPEAVARVESGAPDGIILDLMMPGMDGFEVLDRLRDTPATAGLPVLILTAKDLTRDDLARLRSNHVAQLVQKGDVDREQLLGEVARLLGRNHTGRG
jgi:signal transduction histidine kinase